MADHYSDYLKKAVSAGDLVFDKITDSDKDVVKRVRKDYIRTNRVLLIICSICFAACGWYFVNFLLLPPDSIVYQVVSLSLLGFVMFVCGYYIYYVTASIKGIRRGVVLTASREQENKGGRNSSYQFILDIYLEDRDETLMSFEVEKEVFAEVMPGDGVIVAKCGRKVKVFEDPDRKAVMDVSNIKSGIR